MPFFFADRMAFWPPALRLRRTCARFEACARFDSGFFTVFVVFAIVVLVAAVFVVVVIAIKRMNTHTQAWSHPYSLRPRVSEIYADELARPVHLSFQSPSARQSNRSLQTRYEVATAAFRRDSACLPKYVKCTENTLYTQETASRRRSFQTMSSFQQVQSQETIMGNVNLLSLC